MRRLIVSPSQLTPDFEVGVYQLRDTIAYGFELPADDNALVQAAMRRLQKCGIRTFAVIDTSDPVQALKSFLDVVDITCEITMRPVSEKSFACYGQACYDRFFSKVHEIADKRGVRIRYDTAPESDNGPK